MVSRFELVNRSDSIKDRVTVLDVNVLYDSTFGDVDLQQEVVGMFMEQIDQILTQLREHTFASQAGYIAHTLRGTAAAIGAQEIRCISEDWEKQLTFGAPLIADDMLADLIAARERFIQNFKSHMQQ